MMTVRIVTLMITKRTELYQLDGTLDKGWDPHRNCRGNRRDHCTLPSSVCTGSSSCSETCLWRSCALLLRPHTPASSSYQKYSTTRKALTRGRTDHLNLIRQRSPAARTSIIPNHNHSRELLSITLTYKCDVNWVKVNHHAEYGIQVKGHFVWNTHTHSRPIALPGPLKWNVKWPYIHLSRQ